MRVIRNENVKYDEIRREDDGEHLGDGREVMMPS
jgi:hypothetical protein